MFKKKPVIKPLTGLRSSDRRRLATQIAADLSLPPSIPVDRNALLPDSTRSAKFTTNLGPDLDPVHGTIYVDSHASWIRVDELMFPTLHTVWRSPGLLPVIVTHPEVMGRLKGGADLMVPGLVAPFDPRAKKEALVGIADTARPAVPQAVGVCEIDVGSLTVVQGEKGKAIRILHWVGDEVYKLGDGPVEVPDALNIPRLDYLTFDEAETPEASTKEVVLDSPEHIRDLSTKEIDTAFHDAALYGFHDYSTNNKIDALDFPLSSSAFMSLLVHPFLPSASHFPPYNLQQNTAPHPSLVLKKTSWKNVSKFLKQLDKNILVKTKVRNGNETVVLDVNWYLEPVLNFMPYKLPQDPAANDRRRNQPEQVKSEVKKLEALYRPSGKVLQFFEATGQNKSAHYTKDDLNSALRDYVEANSLVTRDPRFITPDPVLSAALGINGPSARGDLLPKLISGCSPYYRFVGETKIHAGKMPTVSVILEKRQGNKAVTRIFGLEPFGINPKELAEELRVRCAGSATVGQAIGLKPGIMEVMVQGKWADVAKAFVEKRGVDKARVELQDKTGGKKK